MGPPLSERMVARERAADGSKTVVSVTARTVLIPLFSS